MNQCFETSSHMGERCVSALMRLRRDLQLCVHFLSCFFYYSRTGTVSVFNVRTVVKPVKWDRTVLVTQFLFCALLVYVCILIVYNMEDSKYTSFSKIALNLRRALKYLNKYFACSRSHLVTSPRHLPYTLRKRQILRSKSSHFTSLP